MAIEYEHTLPALNIEGRHNGTYNNAELSIPGVLTVNDSRLGVFMQTLRDIVRFDRRLVFVDGRKLTASNNWVRDFTHEMKGFIHWEYDLRSFLDFFIDTQREDGQFFEVLKQIDDGHYTFVDEANRVMYPEDNQSLIRLEVEADVEYLMVEAVHRVYGVLGDDAWLKKALPALDKGLVFITSDAKRWDAEHGLVKRPFTIDTWDFEYDPDNKTHASLDRRIRPDSRMSVMHGDNTGVYDAMGKLAWLYRRVGEEAKAAEWEAKAEKLKENIFRYLYNGTFFIHQLHLNHEGADDREGERLSLSNAYALNRGILTQEQGRRLIDEYRRRGKECGFMAEWFTIYPPYEDFLGYKPGEYVNGAVSPFTAGELAKGAFSVGYEAYGWDILSRFITMAERDKTVCFLYSPVDGAPQNGQGPSGWGAASLLSAVDEGLAGIVNRDVGYRVMDFSPRFPVTHYDELRYFTGYEKTDCVVELRYIRKEIGLRYDLYSPAEKVNAHILLPEGKTAGTVLVDGVETAFTPTEVGKSLYVDFTVTPIQRRVSMEVLYR